MTSLTMEVWTDGTISAKEAVSLAAKVLNEHLNLFVDLSDEGYTERDYGRKGRQEQRKGPGDDH